MNRLILIGNGFDLAHNLKTSYCHFITDYITNAINKFYENNRYDDQLLEIKFRYSGYGHSPQDRETRIKNDVAWHVFNNISRNEYYSVRIKSDFLSETIEKVTTIDWVDLENDYFENLVECKMPEKQGGYDLKSVELLNNEFDFIKEKLEEYLIRHQSESKLAYSPVLKRIFCEKIKSKDIVTVNITDHLPQKLMLLSFNYTATLKKYQLECSKLIPTKLNYIHGELDSKENPIIFGFGDEYNKSYLEFEELKSKELLKHIKSFGYFKASNYHNLTRFLDDDDFQVYIFGHSLGLSDRTMLKQIFEHQKCKSIKLFFYDKGNGVNDFTDKTFDISSHFSDKGLMRKKIVPFDLSLPMPQPGFPD